MRVRVAGIWKHPKSGIYWFRMAVPARHRIAVGKREIKESLQTRTEALARQKHAAKLAEVASLFARLDREFDQDVGQQALAICRRGFDQLSRRNLFHHDDGVTTLAEAEDNVLLGMLMVLTYRVRCTWGDDHAIRAELELLGEHGGDAFPDLLPAAIADRDEQDRSAEAVQCLEGNFIPVLAEDGQEFHVHRSRRSLSGIVYREIAAALLRREDWKFVELEVVLVAEAARVPVQMGTRLYDSVAIRDIPLHEIAVDGGLLELGKIRRNEGSEWLFPDLKADKFGDRYKLLSRKINRQIRLCGVTADDKCFYSARHAHKREVRRQRISEANSDQMSGHGNGKSVGRKYGQGAPIETLKEDNDRVTFRGVDWEPVILCSLTRIARLSQKTSKSA